MGEGLGANGSCRWQVCYVLMNERALLEFFSGLVVNPINVYVIR